MDYAALKTELTTDPAGLGYAPLIASGNDGGLATLLNARLYRGYVPIAEMAAYCVSAGVTGAVLTAKETPVGTAGMTTELKGAIHTVLTLIQIDFRLNWADTDNPKFGPACDGLIAAGLMQPADKAALLSLGDNRASRAWVLFGGGDPAVGAAVTADDVSNALKGAR